MAVNLGILHHIFSIGAERVWIFAKDSNLISKIGVFVSDSDYIKCGVQRVK
jgi:hypothetical protein